MQGYKVAAALLPAQQRTAAAQLPQRLQDQASEFRLRRGYPPTVLLSEGERVLADCVSVRAEELSLVLENAARASPYAVQNSMAQGYIIAAGGVRVGLCGQIRVREDGPDILGVLTSLSIRIPRQVKGCAAPLMKNLF